MDAETWRKFIWRYIIKSIKIIFKILKVSFKLVLYI